MTERQYQEFLAIARRVLGKMNKTDLTQKQKEYLERELNKISGSGDEHSAYVIDHIGGMGSMRLCDVSPAVVGFGQDNDPCYQQYLHNWDEVNALIANIREAAEKAWGKQL